MGDERWAKRRLCLLFLCFQFVRGIEIVPAPLLRSERSDDLQRLGPVHNLQPAVQSIVLQNGTLSAQDIERAIEEARASVLGRFSVQLRSDSSRLPVVVQRNVTISGLIAEEATRLLAVRHRLTKDDIAKQLTSFSVAKLEDDDCPVEDSVPCRPQKYRSHDSFCNNVQNPRWGSAIAPYARLIPADYSDGVSSLRISITGQQLPPASLISEKIHGTSRIASGFLTTLAAVWSQFIQNDISGPITFSEIFGTTSCCAGGSQSACLQIVSADGKVCRDYQRLASSSRRKCSLGPREALNGMTAFLDGSSIYGTVDGEESELRLFEQGLMKTSPGDLVPLMSEGAVCNPKSPNSTCYKTGDPRVNGHPALIALHTLFLREHNRLVQKLAEVNPLWDDDTLYEEARRINIAAIQHITYKEFLPAILGESLTESLKLKPKLSGYSSDYDIFAYPGTLEVTAGAILDFVLSMIPEKFDTYGMKGEKKKSMSMVDMAEPLTNQQVEEIVLGLVSSMANRVGLSITPAVRMLHGRDVAAEIITRGRDLGIPGYTAWRKYCGLRVPTSFEDMGDMMPQPNIQLLQTVYKDVSDIDLFTAGLAEIPLKGAVVGPTFGCLMAHQFTTLRRADRFWYENDVPSNSFSKQQLQEIRKVTLASLICKNFENIPAVPPRAFQEKDAFLNSPVACNLMPDIDLTFWESDSPALQVPDDLMEISIMEAMKKLEKRRHDEELLFKNNLGADPKSAIGTAFGFSRPTMAAIYMSNTSLLLEYASLQFLENLENPEFIRTRRQLFNNVANFFNQLGQQLNTRRPNSGRALAQGLPNVDVGRFVNTPSPPQPCRGNEDTLPCDHTTPFRTFSGHCNNLANPTFGKQLSTFSRLLPAGYDDGISRPRWRSVTGRPLPSPRLISITVHQDFSSPHRRYTMILMQFGQFLDHDITMTPVSRGVQNAILNCRDCDSTRNVHPECWPIPIPANDPFFPRVNAQGKPQCIPFTRSLAGQQRLGARDQVNQNTAYIDGSQIYGETFCNSRRLRSFVGGRLNSTGSPFRGKELLPQTNRMAECKASSGLCFEAGDARSSEQPGLTIFHTIMMREHNRIAGTLQTMNPQWDDERTYQQSRRINTAVWQHIIYNEFVPRILGWNAVNLYGLNLLTEGYFEGYDANCNGQIFNEFATAAYRFGHSLVRPFFPRVNSAFQETARLPLRAGFFNPETLMENTMLDDFIRGMFVTPMENLDQFVSGEITNHLFESKNFPFSGLDLISLNIQRGRDHGLRPYNEYRAACNLKKAVSFEDLSREIAPELIQRLQQVYASVDDIDIFTGGLSETPLQGGLVGPTFACVIGNQFRTLRRCDRFWYENGNTAGRFTEAQLAEIRKVNFARVICENSDTISEITRSPFDIPHNFLNPRVQCRTLPTMDLNPWRDSDRSCVAQGKVIALGASSLVSPCTSCTCTSEGAQCQSLRVDCQRLLTEVGQDAILADSVCRVQCSFLVPQTAPQPVTPAFQRPAGAPQRQRGARFRNIFRFG